MIMHIETDEIIDELQAAGMGTGKIKAVIKKSLRMTLTAVKREGARHLSKKAKVTQKVLKKHLRIQGKPSLAKNKLSAAAWFGLDPILAGNLGVPKQTATGVTVGGHRFNQAFIITGRNSNKKLVMERHSPYVIEKVLHQIDASALDDFVINVTDIFEGHVRRDLDAFLRGYLK